MPISTEKKTALEAALAAFGPNDSPAVAKLIYDMLLSARLSKDNQNGLGYKAIMSLGRIIYDKVEWSSIPQIEQEINSSIRHPIMQAVDVVFRKQLPIVLPALPEEHKATITAVLAGMDDIELVNLTLLVHQILITTEFSVEKDLKSGTHPFSKFLFSGWTWDDDLKVQKETFSGICLPLTLKCDSLFRQAFPAIFRPEAEAAAEHTTEENTAAPQTAPTAVEEAQVEAKPVAIPTQEESMASDTNPFAAPSDESEPPLPTLPDVPEAVVAAPPETPPETVSPISPETVNPIPVKTASESQPPAVVTTAEQNEPNGETHGGGNGNGQHLSKKERRKLRRQQERDAEAAATPETTGTTPSEPPPEGQAQ